MTPRTLSHAELLLLTLAGAVVTANAYYIHPIIARVAEDFGVSASTIGLVPALNQVALSLGIFLLLPLGDRINNRRLVLIFVVAQFLALVMMALSGQFMMFLIGSTILGFVTIAPYLLPAYVSKRVDPAHLGHVTATLTTGVILGILLARAGAGMIGEYLGWRTVYYIAAGLMLVIALVMPLIMDAEEPEPVRQDQMGYFALLASMGPMLRVYPQILLSGLDSGVEFRHLSHSVAGAGLASHQSRDGLRRGCCGVSCDFLHYQPGDHTEDGKTGRQPGAKARAVLSCGDPVSGCLSVLLLWTQSLAVDDTHCDY